MLQAKIYIDGNFLELSAIPLPAGLKIPDIPKVTKNELGQLYYEFKTLNMLYPQNILDARRIEAEIIKQKQEIIKSYYNINNNLTELKVDGLDSEAMGTLEHILNTPLTNLQFEMIK